MFRLRICDLLHEKSKLLIHAVDKTEVVGVGRIDDIRRECSSQWIVDLDSNIVDGRLRAFMKVFVNADGVQEFDRGQRAYMWKDCFGEQWDVALVPV